MSANNKNQFTVSDKTARCIELLRKLVKTQGEVMDFLRVENLNDTKESDAFCENTGEAIKALGSIMHESIYCNIITEQDEI